MTPGEKIRLTIQLEQTLKQVQLIPAAQLCENCCNYNTENGRMCLKVLQQIPDDYHGVGCASWTEHIPF